MSLRCRCLLAIWCGCILPLAAHADTPAAPPADAPAADAPAADGAAAQPAAELWLNPGFYAYHFQKHRNLNNNAIGFGAEYRFSPASAITGGLYRNGSRNTAHYLAYYWRPIELGPVRLGAIAGVVNGYPGTRKGDWFPAVLPTASVEWGRVGLNIFLIPTVRDSVNGSLTFQLNFRVY